MQNPSGYPDTSIHRNLKIILKITGIAFRALVLLSAAGGLSSCEKNIGKIKKNLILTLPSITVKDFNTVFTDSGKIQLIMTSPLMETYKNADVPYSEFRSGIKVIFYDGHPEPVGSVTSKYAKYTDNDKLWELKDSVVVINQTNDKLETEQLFWDQERDYIYTDRFVKMTNEDQTVLGTGFESDSKLTTRRIKNVSATIYLHEKQKVSSDN
jgi:LPS export ABC transporter protein LptC